MSATAYATPQAVLDDARLSLEEKRALLRCWEWDEYLLDLQAAEAPVADQVSRLDEVRAAMAQLEGAHAARRASSASARTASSLQAASATSMRLSHEC